MEQDEIVGKEGEVRWVEAGTIDQIVTTGTVKALAPDLWISIQADDAYYSIPFFGKTKGIVAVSVGGKLVYENHRVEEAYEGEGPDWDTRVALRDGDYQDGAD